MGSPASVAARRAVGIAERYGRDPWQVASALKLPVYRLPLPRPHRELYVEHRGHAAGLVIAHDANAREARELLAHGLAHHLLHVGDRVTGRSRAVWSGMHERQADDFAAYLLVPDETLRQLGDADEGALGAELTERCGVSPRLARRRLRLAMNS